MSLLQLLSKKDTWESFYTYKTSITAQNTDTKMLREFIDDERYIPVCEKIERGEGLSLPRKAVINKMSSKKSRTVYIYPPDESMVMKLLTYLVLRKYNDLFSPNLYSFRPGRTVADAVRSLISKKGIDGMYAYKVDISNYFNSVPVERLIPDVESVLSDDKALCDFLCALLREEYVLDKGIPVKEQKGIMAGTPIACFYANLYLRRLDEHFYKENVTYIRYSDDIIVFGDSYENVERYADYIRGYLNVMQLAVNPDKESFFTPDDGFVFLGFSYCKGVTDIAPVTVDKLKGKMRRKMRALSRWHKRNGFSGERAARAFIRIFNRKLLEHPEDSELSWSCWFFPVINTAKSLKIIDNYAQDCIRYLVSGKRTKARYRVTYEMMKEMGYRCLVSEFFGEVKSDQRLANSD